MPKRRAKRRNAGSARPGFAWVRLVALAALGLMAYGVWRQVLDAPGQTQTVQTPAPGPQAQPPQRIEPPAPVQKETPAQPSTDPPQPQPSQDFSSQGPQPTPGNQSDPAPQPLPESPAANPRSPSANPTPNTLVSIPGRAEPGLVFRRLQTKNEEKVIALTFDDGPNPQFTPQVLEILARYGARATFFWVGLEAERHPDTARAVAGAGHAVGNHTWTHRTAQSDEAAASDEIDRTAAVLTGVTGSPAMLFRPPGGRLNNGLADYALRNGYAVVMWSAQSNDWEPDVAPETIVQNVLQAARPGAVVLLHDGGGDRTRTVQALPQIIEGLQAQGYRFVTIPEMLEAQRVSQ